MLAARYGHADMIKLLLQSEAPIKAKDKVSKRFFIRTCVYAVVVYVFYLSIVLYDK